MYLDNCKTLEELKQVYKAYARKLHPDMPGGSEKAMKDLNNEYDAMTERLSRYTSAATDNTAAHDTAATMAAYKTVIMALIHLDGLTIELCGRWLWISGDTRRHKDALKAAGCKWASKKLMWYWHAPEDSVISHKHTSINSIRAKYGSTIISSGNAANVVSV